MRRHPNIRPISLSIAVGRQFDATLQPIGNVLVVQFDGKERIVDTDEETAKEFVERVRTIIQSELETL